MTIIPVSAKPVEHVDVPSDQVDPNDPAAIMNRLAEIEDRIAVAAPQLGYWSGRLAELKDARKRIELSLWPSLPVTKLAKDREAVVQATLEADPSNLCDHLVAADANYEVWKVAFDSLERRASIMQSLLKRHSRADEPSQHGQGSHHR